jgi:hypothetical protein
LVACLGSGHGQSIMPGYVELAKANNQF